MNTTASPSLLTAFLQALATSDFSGETSVDDAQLTVYSTDNSVYLRRPQAIIWPKTVSDIRAVMRLAGKAEFRKVVITARGGGTGTNGQSLTDGIVVDLSRFMTGILEIDPERRIARVQAGVVKDQLNAALKPYGLFFAPELSTSNRATIGGMINTDASGQGSCRYGKTRDHVLGLTTVLLGGEVLESEALAREDWQGQMVGKSPAQQQLYRQLFDLADENQALIAQSFPRLNRCLTGYDLPHLLDGQHFDVNSVLCGSEGSLGLIAEATLNLEVIPKYRALINIGYGDFLSALRDAKALMALAPLSIETVDSKVLGLAKGDIVWESVAEYFPETPGKTVDGINLVEVDGESEAALESAIAAFLQHLQNDDSVARYSQTIARGAANIAPLYAMRKRAVGLLGNVQGEKRPIAFVEDCAVPPENLADFIADFRAVLDEMNLSYGMFGHVDAGVLHVRPQVDQKSPELVQTLHEVTDKVVALVQQYGGVLWGEHGKGLRSGYAPRFFGEAWPLIQTVKAAFDPHNQLNPGKIATPSTQPQAKLTGLTEIGLRGTRDQKIPQVQWQAYGNAMYCNGNGACFNYDFDDPMCPSWKITRDRVHSPKGRAMLVKEWLTRQTENTLTPAFETQVYDALHGCLSCKSCAGQCPVKVDIPDAKSRFLADYHTRARRKLRDYTIGNLEFMMPTMVRFAGVYNAVQRCKPIQTLQRKWLKMVDAPLIHPQAKTDLATVGARMWRGKREDDQAEAVILVQDGFTRYFDSPVFFDWLRLLQLLGVQAYVLPYFPNGKPLHVHGFLDRFKRLRDKNAKLLTTAAESGLPLIGLDPAMTLVFRQEYRMDLREAPDWKVLLPQEWLVDFLAQQPAQEKREETYYLAGHCTEKTQLPASSKQWQQIFAHFGMTLEPVATGCCGMAGTYGHEAEHRELSAGLYAQSWQKPVADYGARLLTTGYSCRSQAKRLDQVELRHPLQILLNLLVLQR